MLRLWGKDYYGLFALSSSLLVSMALLDGGVTSLTRLRLAEALKSGDRELFRRAYSEGLLTFASVVSVAVGGIAVLGSLGLLSKWLNLPDGGDFVLVVTALLTGIFMISVLLMQPLAAEGKLSALKAANTWGCAGGNPCRGGCVGARSFGAAGHGGLFALPDHPKPHRVVEEWHSCVETVGAFLGGGCHRDLSDTALGSVVLSHDGGVNGENACADVCGLGYCRPG